MNRAKREQKIYAISKKRKVEKAQPKKRRGLKGFGDGLKDSFKKSVAGLRKSSRKEKPDGS